LDCVSPRGVLDTARRRRCIRKVPHWHPLGIAPVLALKHVFDAALENALVKLRALCRVSSEVEHRRRRLYGKGHVRVAPVASLRLWVVRGGAVAERRAREDGNRARGHRKQRHSIARIGQRERHIWKAQVAAAVPRPAWLEFVLDLWGRERLGVRLLSRKWRRSRAEHLDKALRRRPMRADFFT
jgi:hypothetical protein